MAEPKELKRGWTTGACATAATKAAFLALLTGSFPDPVGISLPRGEKPFFSLAQVKREGDFATAGIIKDAGDDPDVTHGALILATVRRRQRGSGISFAAGPGVGKITKPGLPLPPGEAAINPAPRAMMRAVLEEVAKEYDTYPDAEITISIPGGKEIAKKTWNARLGILGGLSILGTTGIVHPYSCSAWIASIHRGIDVIRAAGRTHAGAATGSTTEEYLQRHYALPPEAIIDMGDFAGGMLKYLRHHLVPRVTMALGFGKAVKLADGHLDLHSGRSQVNLQHLAQWAKDAGSGEDLTRAIQVANTALDALSQAQTVKFPLGTIVAQRARQVAQDIAGKNIHIDVVVIDRSGNLVGKSAPEEGSTTYRP